MSTKVLFKLPLKPLNGTGWRWICLAGIPLCLLACGSEPQSRVIEKSKTLESAPSEVWDGKVLKVELPEGWIPEPVFGMRDESFRIIGNNGQETEVTVTALPITGGTVESNVERWANQVGVSEPTSNPVEIGGLSGVTVELFPGSDGDGNLAILGAILEDGQQRRFIKFSGPPESLNAQRENWEYFLESIHWKEGR